MASKTGRERVRKNEKISSLLQITPPGTEDTDLPVKSWLSQAEPSEAIVDCLRHAQECEHVQVTKKLRLKLLRKMATASGQHSRKGTTNMLMMCDVFGHDFVLCQHTGSLRVNGYRSRTTSQRKHLAIIGMFWKSNMFTERADQEYEHAARDEVHVAVAQATEMSRAGMRTRMGALENQAGDALEIQRRSSLHEAKAEIQIHQKQSQEHLQEFNATWQKFNKKSTSSRPREGETLKI